MRSHVLSMVRPMAVHWLPNGSTAMSGASTETSARALARWVVDTLTSKVGAGVAVVVIVPVKVGRGVAAAVQVNVGVTDG